MVITNGFTYIAFLMCLAGVLLALEKYTKWKNLQPGPAFGMDLCIEHDFLHHGPVPFQRGFRSLQSAEE